MTAPHPFWSRVPEWLLDWALRRLYLPLTLEATRRLVERHAAERAARPAPEPAVVVPPGEWTPERVAAFNAPHPAPLRPVPDPYSPLAPPSPALPMQVYGTPPPRSVLGRDPLATTEEE